MQSGGDLARAIGILEGAMLFLRRTYRKTLRGNYTPTQRWFGAGNRWKDVSAREGYYCLYNLLMQLKKRPSYRKNRKP